MCRIRILFLVFIAMAYAASAPTAEKSIRMNLVSDQGVGESIGTITATDSQFGLILTPQLSNLPQGIHGFHVHQNPDCSHVMPGGKPMAALAAGGHYDPDKTDRHAGPYGNGHLGDLPFLYVDKEGKASLPVLAPRLKVADLQGRSLMIHTGGDNYSDLPEKLGGGGNANLLRRREVTCPCGLGCESLGSHVLEVCMSPTEPPALLKWSAEIILVRRHADGSTGPESDGEATLVEPVAVEHDGRAWMATRTYRLQVSCLDGKKYHGTVVIQSPHIPEPDNPTEAQIIEYNDAVRPHVLSADGQVSQALKTLRLKCTEFAIPDVRCSLLWKDTTKRFDDALPATFYTLHLILDVGTDAADGELGPVKKGRREWSRSGRADGSRSHYGCSGSASFTVDRMNLDGMSEEALRQLAESYVTYCNPFGNPFQLT